MKLRNVIICGFLLITILVASVGLIGMNSTKQASEVYSELRGSFAPFTKSATDITSFSKRAEGHLFLYLTFGDPLDRDKFYMLYNSLNEEIASVSSLAKSPEQKEIIEELESQSVDILKFGEALLKEYDKDPSSFNLKNHEKLTRKFYDSTSGARKSGVELAKISRELFLDQDALNLNTDITSFSKRAEGHLYLYLTFGDPLDRDKFFSRYKSMEDTIRRLDEIIEAPEQKEIIEELESQSVDILKFGEALLKEYDKDPSSFNLKNHEKLTRKFYDSTSGARKSGVELAKIKTDAIANKIGEMDSTVRNIQRNSLIFVVIVLLLSISLGGLISYLVTKPIKDLSKIVDEISKGNFEAEFGGLRTDITEVKILTESLSRVMKTMKLAVLEKQEGAKEFGGKPLKRSMGKQVSIKAWHGEPKHEEGPAEKKAKEKVGEAPEVTEWPEVSRKEPAVNGVKSVEKKEKLIGVTKAIEKARKSPAKEKAKGAKTNKTKSALKK